MKTGILIVGHSHSVCLSEAARDLNPDGESFEVITTIHGKDTHLDNRPNPKTFSRFQDPEAVCTCLQGNWHNSVGLIEHTDPFSVGDAKAGALPDADGRAFIPRAIVAEAIRAIHLDVRNAAERLFAAYPSARPIRVCPPPPFGDPAHLERHAGAFADKRHLGLAPRSLTKALYDILIETYAGFANELGATLILPHPNALTEDGFLAVDYRQPDPTHANAAYGNLMLGRILETLRGTA